MPDAPDLLKGALAGLVGGLAASWAMNQYQAAVPQETFRQLLGERPEPDEGGSDDGAESEPATVRTAEAVSEAVFDHELTDEEKETAGPAVHFGFGAALGTAYGGAAEVWSGATAGFGAAYGAAVWAGADNAALPALGLARSPTRYPPSTHLYALSSHLVYGVVLEGVRRLVRAAL